MLKSLFGNKNIERILLFLLVNENCYAHQLSYLLNIPLTPLQNALSRLENGKILVSEIKKKKRIYNFNPDCELIQELEMLLKKAYANLPVEEKKQYHYVHTEQKKQNKHFDNLLIKAWEYLSHVSQMSIHFQLKKNSAVNPSKKGKGSVVVHQDASKITFDEKGIWTEDKLSYHNKYRFSLNKNENLITLEHLRFGENNPVFLFHLTPTKQNILESINPHLCKHDTYFGWMEITELFLRLHIRTIGPNKNEKIEYIYL